MADVSLPQAQDYYRVTYRSASRKDVLIANRLTQDEVQERLRLSEILGQTVEKVEHVIVSVEVMEVKL